MKIKETKLYLGLQPRIHNKHNTNAWSCLLNSLDILAESIVHKYSKMCQDHSYKIVSFLAF